MRHLTPFFIIALLMIFGLQTTNAQVDLSGFEQLFNSAVANTNTTGTSVGGGGTTTNQNQNQQGDRDGGGSMDMINSNWPATGKMVIRSTKLTWDEGIQPTTISIKQGIDEVFKSPVSGQSITIDFGALNLDANKTYDIRLSSDDKKSRKTALTFVPASELEAAMKELENDIEYKKADGLKKKLMKAFYLESKGFNYEAFEAYHISTSDPGDMQVILTFFNGFKSRT